MRRSLPFIRIATVGLAATALSVLGPGAAAVPVGNPAHATTPAVVGQQAAADELLVGYVSGAGEAERERARGRAAARLAERVVRGSGARAEVELVRLPAGADRARAVRDLKADPAVAYAEPNWTQTHSAASTDPTFTNGELWGMYGPTTNPANQYGSNAAAAWAAGKTGSTGVYVGVIDEGIQYNHPDLAGQVGNPGELGGKSGVDDDRNGYVDDVYGWDFDRNDNTVYDGGTSGRLDDHGTHVAGTIGAKANSAGVVGVNWNVRMISGKFLGRNGGTTANSIKAIDYFTDLKKLGVNIVATNNSWGGGGKSQAVQDAIERANTAGIVFVAAAGNGGGDGVGDNNDTTPHYPSSYPNNNIVSVAAITKTGTRAAFSNYGATHVDLGAPGADIWSTTAYNGYSSYSGTSMATPHVTGAAALYASVKPGASAAIIKAALLRSAVPTASLSAETVTGGRLDVNAALAQ
ncbi:MAG: Serine protease, subtilase family [uncultured Propionibacteriaceae bacterium]|uniref:Serine protease, subtilase family n=1 Tax=uncultured Propionibacteriaceae bacterium TaxID=257457 RepID=A0A6J4PAT9_9ACTN|nr:MAG: Serine protease, subtilase family [uncultured Propionibacteriaceae bacterium]